MPQVVGLGTAADDELDLLAKKATQAYDDLMDLGMNVEAQYSSRIFEVAKGMLSNAITAKTAKLDKKIKIVELQLKKAKLEYDRERDNKVTPVVTVPLAKPAKLNESTVAPVEVKVESFVARPPATNSEVKPNAVVEELKPTEVKTNAVVESVPLVENPTEVKTNAVVESVPLVEKPAEVEIPEEVVKIELPPPPQVVVTDRNSLIARLRELATNQSTQ